MFVQNMLRFIKGRFLWKFSGFKKAVRSWARNCQKFSPIPPSTNCHSIHTKTCTICPSKRWNCYKYVFLLYCQVCVLTFPFYLRQKHVPTQKFPFIYSLSTFVVVVECFNSFICVSFVYTKKKSLLLPAKC